MSDNNKQKNFKDTIVIDSSLSDNSSDVITINSGNSNDQHLEKNYSFKVSPDGKVMISNLLNNLEENHLKGENLKEMLTNELIKYGFENIPADLTEIQLKNLLEFLISKMVKNIEFGQIYPFSVEKDNTGDLTIILLMYNWNTISFSLGNIPLKLKDANDKVIFAGLVDLKKVISPNKIGIYYLKISKDTLKEDNMNLNTWTITFES